MEVDEPLLGYQLECHTWGNCRHEYLFRNGWTHKDRTHKTVKQQWVCATCQETFTESPKYVRWNRYDLARKVLPYYRREVSRREAGRRLGMNHETAGRGYRVLDEVYKVLRLPRNFDPNGRDKY